MIRSWAPCQKPLAMSLRLTRPLRRSGSLLALLALAVQLAAFSVVLAPDMPATGLDALVAASICHAGTTSDQAPQPQHPPTCAVCPLCQAIALAGTLLAPPGFVLVAPAMPAARASRPPPARAPPARAVASAYPRGPPRLI